MQFIHISDLRFNPENDGRTSRNIREDLIPYLHGLNITADELLITGDYRNAKYTEKNQDQINAVVEYIRKIAEAVNIRNVKHIHLVPGNHDRDRDGSELQKMDEIRNNYDPDNGDFKEKDLCLLLQKFDYFQQLCNTLYGAENYWKSGDLHTYRNIGDTVFLYLNTAIMHNCDEDRDQHRLIIGNDCFDRLLDDICKEYPNYPIIVLAHHSLDCFEQHEKEAVEEILRKHPSVFLYLCGGAHEAWIRKVNHHLEISMGCLKHERNVETTFLWGDTASQDYTVHHYVRKWQPYTAYNEQLQECCKELHNNTHILEQLRAGKNLVTFGNYPHTKDDRKRAIEWNVLNRGKDGYQLISRYAIDSKKYHEYTDEVKWETSSLHDWLNGEFFTTAFSSEEQKIIVPVKVYTEQNLKCPPTPDSYSADRVFLPSPLDIEKWCPSVAARQCIPTQYAIKRGAKTSRNEKTEERNCCSWWLRSPGLNADYAACVGYDGAIGYNGIAMGYDEIGVRVSICIQEKTENNSTEDATPMTREIGGYLLVDNTEENCNVIPLQDTEEATPRLSIVEKLRNGEKRVSFGSYPQEKGGSICPIEWMVLKQEEDCYLLISRYALEFLPYDEKGEESTWEKCSLHKWLNEDFFNTAFSKQERKLIQPVNVSSEKCGLTIGPVGDNMFLLSKSEFQDEKLIFSENDRACDATDYAAEKRSSVSEEYPAENCTCEWWLRPPTGESSDVCQVNFTGSINLSECTLNDITVGVRPAFWIRTTTEDTSENETTKQDVNAINCLYSLEGHTGIINCVAVLPNGRVISGSEDTTLRVWDVSNRRCLQTLTGHSIAVNCVAALSHDRVVSGSDDATLRVWDVSTGNCLQVLQGENKHTAPVTCVDVLNDGRIVSCSQDNTLKVWDPTTGQCLQTLKGHNIAINCFAIISNELVVSGSRDNTLRVWDVNSGKCLKTLDKHSRSVYCIGVLQDGSVVSGSWDNTLRIWDVSNGECLQTLTGHSGKVNCFAILPGRCVVSGSDDKTLRVWKATTGQCLTTLEGHHGKVTCVAVLLDGLIVSGSDDNTLRVWNVKGNCLQTLEEHESTVSCIATLPEGLVVSVATSEKNPRVWKVNNKVGKK